jgi:prepilin-type N-terminal cleavage/methylation domain-containing protein/prepilin-type processing-associated H-X9-DG protein
MEKHAMKNRRSGFTLVELLVVIAIIGTLVALLLPAVQAARESARRSQCVNNLKQLGLGFQNYHDAQGQLPGGSISCCWGTWQMAILPYIEQQQLGALYKFLPKEGMEDPLYPDRFKYEYFAQPSTENPHNQQVVRTRVAMLTCPSDEARIDGRQVTYHNYVANYGNTSHVGIDYPGPLATALPTYIKYQGSPFIGYDQFPQPDLRVEFRAITDGLSNTLIASETIQGAMGTYLGEERVDYRGMTWWGWGAGFETRGTPNTSEPDTMQRKEDCYPEEPNPPCISPFSAGNRFWAAARSRHQAGVNAAMCDGSVHFVIDGIDLAIWRAASSTQGEETASLVAGQ